MSLNWYSRGLHLDGIEQENHQKEIRIQRHATINEKSESIENSKERKYCSRLSHSCSVRQFVRLCIWPHARAPLKNITFPSGDKFCLLPRKEKSSCISFFLPVTTLHIS